MTFYIPPVFLFGNKIRHIRNNQEKNKDEYKTATETGIQIENRNIKRIEELEEENRTLKDKIEFLTNCLDDRDKSIAIIQEENKKLKADTEHTIKFNNKIIGELKLENKKLKADYIKLSKIVETTGGYKASYVNELRDKIAKLEKKLKTVTEGEIIIPIYDEEGKLVMK